MSQYREAFAEYNQTVWRGCRVRVTVELPEEFAKSSMTTQLVIDDHQLHDLKYLKKFPMDIDAKSPIWQEWTFKRDIAMKTVSMLAEKIAYDICHAIGKEI